jgi:hypothetical protein
MGIHMHISMHMLRRATVVDQRFIRPETLGSRQPVVKAREGYALAIDSAAARWQAPLAPLR